MNRIEQFRSGIQEITADFGRDQVAVQATDTEFLFQSGPGYDMVEYRANLPSLPRAVTIKLVGTEEGRGAQLTRLLDIRSKEWIDYVRFYDTLPHFESVLITDKRSQADALNIVKRPLTSRASRLAIASLTDKEHALLLLKLPAIGSKYVH